MQLDLKKMVIFISQWLVACVVLAWEQSFSLPFLFFVLCVIFVRYQPKYYREGLAILLGICFAGLYNLSFAIGVIWLFGLLGISYVVGRFTPALRWRVTLAGVVGSLLLSLVGQVEITLSKMVILAVSLALFWIGSYFIRWEVRHVPISNANWGWQQ